MLWEIIKQEALADCGVGFENFGGPPALYCVLVVTTTLSSRCPLVLCLVLPDGSQWFMQFRGSRHADHREKKENDLECESTPLPLIFVRLL